MRRLTATVTARMWGPWSRGIVIPSEIVKKLEIEAGEILIVTFEKV